MNNIVERRIQRIAIDIGQDARRRLRNPDWACTPSRAIETALENPLIEVTPAPLTWFKTLLTNVPKTIASQSHLRGSRIVKRVRIIGIIAKNTIR